MQTHLRNVALLSTPRRQKFFTSRHPVQTPVQDVSSTFASSTSALLINSHLGTILSSSCLLDDDIDRIPLASSAFGHLQSSFPQQGPQHVDLGWRSQGCLYLNSSVWQWSLDTLYRSRVAYASLPRFTSVVFSEFSGWHAWTDRIPHVEIFQCSDCFSIEVLIIKRATTLDRACNPHAWESFAKKKLLRKAPVNCRSCGGQRKRYKDHLHSVLKQSSIPAPELESLAACRSTWRSTCHDAVVSFEARRTEARQPQRQNRHLRQAGVPLPPGTVSSVWSATIAAPPTSDCAVACGYTTVHKELGSSSSTSTNHHHNNN